MRKTVNELASAKRDKALADIRTKVDGGSLTIRQMTPEERARYGPAGEGRRARRS
jgi:hypothetical protein